MSQQLFQCQGADRKRIISLGIFSVVCVALGVMGAIMLALDASSFDLIDIVMSVIMVVLVIYGLFGFAIVITSRKAYLQLFHDHLEARTYRFAIRHPFGEVITLPYAHIQHVVADKSVVHLTFDGHVSQVPCPSEAVADQASTLIARHLRH